MILSPEVITLLILNMIFLFFGTIAFFLSVKIYLYWDINSTSAKQYSIEKQSFLAATIIKYIFAIKLPLFLFFIFTLDKISNVLTGAMCAAGVVDATPYGIYLFVFKLVNIYLFGFWLLLHYLDIKKENLPYTKFKFAFFIVAFFMLFAEIVLEGIMFAQIDIDKMVSCCGTLFSNSAGSYISQIFKLDTSVLLFLFYGSFILILIFSFLKKYLLLLFTNIFFIIISIISLIIFFSTYIYELPTHHCPFCFLQKDYFYMGYFLYVTLFVGTFFGISSGVANMTHQENRRSRFFSKVSLIFNSVYVILVTSYVLFYYIKNGVFL